MRRFVMLVIFLLLLSQAAFADGATYETFVNEDGNEVTVATDENGNKMTFELIDGNMAEVHDYVDDWEVISMDEYEAMGQTRAEGTGKASSTIIWVVVACIAVASIVGVLLLRRKRGKERA